MSVFPFNDILSTFKDGISRALRVKSESSITGGYSPANLTMQNAVTANGNGTTLNVNEYATAVLEIRGTFSATINFECSIDDTNWYPVLATKNDGTISSSCTTVGLYEIKVAAWKSIRARVSGYVSGNVTVVGKVSPLVNSEKSVQLTGSNAVLLKTFTTTFFIGVSTALTRYYGENQDATAAGLMALNVSKYKSKMVRVKNTMDKAIDVGIRGYRSTTLAESEYDIVYTLAPLASGASIWISNPVINPLLNAPYPGLIVSLTSSVNNIPTIGNVVIDIFGGVL